MIAALLKARNPGGVAGAATGASGGASNDSVAPAIRELEGANPEFTMKQLQDIKKRMADMIPLLAMRAPGAARAIASTFKGLDSALKELQQAQATLSAVGGGPIKSSSVPMPQPPGGPTMPNLPNSANVSM
jgi:hypothetical protein